MNKDKKQLLNEELSKFNKLLNYDFYDGKKSVSESKFHGMNEYKPEEGTDKTKLIFGSQVEEAEEEETNPAIPEAPVDDAIAPEGEIAPEDMPDPSLDAGPPIPEMGGEPTDDGIPMDNTMPVDDTMSADDAMGDESVDLDVTELVKGSQEAKASADEANAKIERLMDMVDQLENQLTSMSQISTKIDGLEQELEKRMPTPDEKVGLRSMDSYPYNIKLSDFWSDKQDSPYSEDDDEEKDEEGNYTLTNDDVDNYDATQIKQSFNKNPYEEEEIN